MVKVEMRGKDLYIDGVLQPRISFNGDVKKGRRDTRTYLVGGLSSNQTIAEKSYVDDQQYEADIAREQQEAQRNFDDAMGIPS